MNETPGPPPAGGADARAEHARWLELHGYPVPPTAELDPAERALIDRHGYWLEALATRRIAPLTPAQARFVQVAGGELGATTPFEIAWLKCRQGVIAPAPVQEVELASRLARLEAARVAQDAVRREYDARREALLARIQPELEALDAAFAPRLDALREEATQAEADAKQAILAYGSAFRYGRIQARYSRGRVTWDGRGLATYLESHPEIGVFRRVGQPSVTFVLRPPEEDARGPGIPADPTRSA